jgi:hypothetical protein
MNRQIKDLSICVNSVAPTPHATSIRRHLRLEPALRSVAGALRSARPLLGAQRRRAVKSIRIILPSHLPRILMKQRQ